MAAMFLKSRSGLAMLLFCAFLGLIAWLGLRVYGLSASGLSREAFWGLLTGQAVFFSNTGAGALALLLFFALYGPAGKKSPGRPALPQGRHFPLGLFAAAACFCAGGLFMFVSLGQPRLILNIFFPPRPSSLFFWLALLTPLGLLLGAGLGRVAQKRQSLQLPPPPYWRAWLAPGLGLALAFLLAQALFFQAFPGRGYWQNAALAARLWASAFCSGAALLLLCQRLFPAGTGCPESPESPESPVWQSRERFLMTALGLSLGLNLLFFLMELFAAFYGGGAALAAAYKTLFFGEAGRVCWFNFPIWLGALLTIGSALLFLLPSTRQSRELFPWVLCMALAAGWLDKSLALPLGGLAPGAPALYAPSFVEIFLSLGIWAAALLFFALLNRPLRA